MSKLEPGHGAVDIDAFATQNGYGGEAGLIQKVNEHVGLFVDGVIQKANYKPVDYKAVAGVKVTW